MIKKLFKKKTEQEKLREKVDSFRERNIPKRYNQIKLAEHFYDEGVYHFMSISNRADGKTFNYLNFSLRQAVDDGIGFCFVVRHFTVRESGQKIYQKIIDTFDNEYNYRDFIFMGGNFYITLYYKDRAIGIITDLNSVTDLKYQSDFLKDFPFIIYDEFLALQGDYLIDEWERLKTLYSSINRGNVIPKMGKPKLLYLGNAVNFSSPIIANLNLFNILERHKMNTVKRYGKIMLEFNKNTQANEVRNLEAFDEHNDSMTHGEFNINKHNIATDSDLNRINKNPNFLHIKLKESYLKITYNTQTFECILSIVSWCESYDYNLYVSDNKEDSTYLNDSFFHESHERKFEKDIYLFDNMYSKDYITEGSNYLTELRINKVIKHHYSTNTLDNFEMNEKIYKENYIENTKKNLFKRFLE